MLTLQRRTICLRLKYTTAPYKRDVTVPNNYVHQRWADVRHAGRRVVTLNPIGPDWLEILLTGKRAQPEFDTVIE